MKSSREYKNTPISFLDYLMALGKLSGCHQLPKRSFFIKGRQFPVCARCTGVFIGYIIGGILYFFIHINIFLCLVFCLVMFIDWYVQYKDLMQSNNIRRVITGFLCGLGLIQIYFSILQKIFEFFC